ncbi:AraC family transcriptional regulator [Pseudomonas vranovensis]|uniref:AraC family transcriptional regulator n=1 Tax=Pseudomonas vranovensis TaxID=321661 RepID=UPI00336A0F10
MNTATPDRQILDPALEQQRQELADLVRRHAPRAANVESAIEDLYVVQYTESVRSMPALAEPALCILAHGSKEICLGDERYVYDPLHYMVLSVALPISGVLLEASPENPSLGVRMNIDPAQINNLIAEAGPMGVPGTPIGPGLVCGAYRPAVARCLAALDPPAGYAQGYRGAGAADSPRNSLPPVARAAGLPAV